MNRTVVELSGPLLNWVQYRVLLENLSIEADIACVENSAHVSMQ
jgi:hypothetical protein